MTLKNLNIIVSKILKEDFNFFKDEKKYKKQILKILDNVETGSGIGYGIDNLDLKTLQDITYFLTVKGYVDKTRDGFRITKKGHNYLNNQSM